MEFSRWRQREDLEMIPGVQRGQQRMMKPFTETKMQEEMGSSVWKARERKDEHRLRHARHKHGCTFGWDPGSDDQYKRHCRCHPGNVGICIISSSPHNHLRRQRLTGSLDSQKTKVCLTAWRAEIGPLVCPAPKPTLSLPHHVILQLRRPVAPREASF